LFWGGGGVARAPLAVEKIRNREHGALSIVSS
jgi:hypothetical protein